LEPTVRSQERIITARLIWRKRRNTHRIPETNTHVNTYSEQIQIAVAQYTFFVATELNLDHI
jgi:hypothetical protein